MSERGEHRGENRSENRGREQGESRGENGGDNGGKTKVENGSVKRGESRGNLVSLVPEWFQTKLWVWFQSGSRVVPELWNHSGTTLEAPVLARPHVSLVSVGFHGFPLAFTGYFGC